MTIDAGTKRRLTLGLIANWVMKLSGILIQLVQVPVLLHFWTEPVFGEWMILSSVPNYLSFSNIGFGNVASNEMLMAEARGDRRAALQAFQSTWWLILGTMGVSGALVAAALWLLPVARLLGVHNLSPQDTRWIIGYLGMSVLLSQVETLLQCAYRCVGRYSYGMVLKSLMTLGAFAGMLVPVWLGYGPRTAALVYAAGSAAGTLLLAGLVRRDIPWIRFGWEHARLVEIRRLAGPAFAFVGFPAGQALNLQGTLLAVGYALGPVAVVVFSTARTVSRVALQMVQMINFSFEPEFARAFGRGDIALVRTLHRRACQLALGLASVIVAVILLAGPPFLHHWTAGKVPPSRGLLAILLLVVVLSSLWSTSSTLLTATNRHQRLAGMFLVATAVTVAATWALARRFGVDGAASSLLLPEVLMNAYVLPATLRMTRDTLPAFLRSVIELSATTDLRAWLRRLRS